MAGLLPGRPVGLDLLALLDVQRLAALVVLRASSSSGSLPSLAAQTAVAFEPAPHQMRSRRPAEWGSRRSSPGGLGNIGRGFGWAKPSPFEHLEEDLGVAARHVGVGLAFGRHVAEMAPAVDHLLGRAAADAQLQPAARDEVGRPGVLGHVQRVLVAHVDDGRADLDRLVRAPTAASSGNGEPSWRAKWCTRKYAPSAPSSSAATASSIDWSRASDAVRTSEYGDSDQWPKDRNPIFFIKGRLGEGRQGRRVVPADTAETA